MSVGFFYNKLDDGISQVGCSKFESFPKKYIYIHTYLPKIGMFSKN